MVRGVVQVRHRVMGDAEMRRGRALFEAIAGKHDSPGPSFDRTNPAATEDQALKEANAAMLH
jgi:hypothetical protein